MLAMHVRAHHMLATYDNCSIQEMTLHVSIDVKTLVIAILNAYIPVFTIAVSLLPERLL